MLTYRRPIWKSYRRSELPISKKKQQQRKSLEVFPSVLLLKYLIQRYTRPLYQSGLNQECIINNLCHPTRNEPSDHSKQTNVRYCSNPEINQYPKATPVTCNASTMPRKSNVYASFAKTIRKVFKPASVRTYDWPMLKRTLTHDCAVLLKNGS